MRTGNRKTWRIASALAVLGVVPIVIDQLVETDREQVTARLEGLAEAVVANDARRALSFFEGGEHLDVENGMNRVHVHEGLRIKQVKVDVNDSSADCDFRANGMVDVQGIASNRHVATRWKLTWEKKSDDWKITRVTRLNPVTGEDMGMFAAQ